MDLILLYVASLLLAGWGTAHFIPTGNVVRGFGSISEDNRNILKMEWINEGATLIFLAILIITVSLIDRTSLTSQAVYWTVAGFLNVFSIISIFTGFRVNFLPYKLCPVIFTSASIMILIGGIVLR
jgi:hypothetical protein